MPSAWLCCAGLALLVACSEPPFRIHVTFTGPVELETGAEVRYQGVRVGSVTAVALRQAEPNQPARVELALAIEDRSVTLRQGDVFEIVTDGLLGEDYVRVTASPEASAPLADGATVAGLPPFVTRAKESVADAIDSLGSLAREKSEALLDALERGRQAEAEDEAQERAQP